MYIACPRCDWRPPANAEWLCTCGHTWNAFHTHGTCPSCGQEWPLTQCTPIYGCGEWSDHEEWYHEEDSRTVEEFLADLRGERQDSPPDASPSGDTALTS